MKTKLPNKRIPKVKKRTISRKDYEKKPKALKEWENTPDKTFDYEASFWSDISESILREANLPYAVNLTIYKGEDDAWQTEQPTTNSRPIYVRLDCYITKYMKYHMNSDEGLAARILSTIHEIKQQTHDKSKLLLAYDFGVLRTYLYICRSESKTNKNNASTNRKKQWIVDLAKYLVKEYPSLANDKYWDEIPNVDGENDKGRDPLLGCYISQDESVKKDYLYTENTAYQGEKILRSTFKRDYIQPAKGKIKQK